MEGHDRSVALRILLIEDTSGDLSPIRRLLAESGDRLQVESAGRLFQARPHLAAGVDAVLLDLSLPDNRGIDTVLELRSMAPGVPLLTLAECSDEPLALRSVQEGADDYLLKGRVNGDGLARAIRYAVERHRDGAERERTERALHETNAALQALVAASPVAIFAVDTDTRVTLWNDAAERVYGWTAAEVLGRPYPAVPEDRREEFRIENERLLAGESFTNLETKRHRRDGSLVDLSVSAAPMPGAGGKPRGFIVVAADISERKRAEAAREGLAAIIEAMPQLVAIAGTDGRLTYLNAGGSRMLGIPPGADTSSFRVEDLYEEDARALIQGQGMPAALRDGVWSAETMLRGAAGESIPASLILLARRGADGQPESVAVIAHDLRRRRRLEEGLRQAQKMEAVGRLASGVAHDMNNLLMPIMVYASMLIAETKEGEPGHEYAQQIAGVAERAAGLPRQLLAFSRKQVLQPEVLDLSVLVANAEKMLRRMIAEDVELEVVAAPDLALIRADPGQVEQVLLNLLVNARNAMPHGGRVCIRTAMVHVPEDDEQRPPALAPGRYVLLSVSDRGCGMDAETLSHIFEPFFTTKEVGKGTGLGLSTVYGIVAQSGGAVRVQSRVGKGTTFSIYLPALEGVDEGAQGAEPTEAPQGGSGTILLAEDEDVVRRAARDILEAAGYEVLVAADGLDALEVSRRYAGRIDLLVTDVIMPHLGGRELAGRLGATHPGVPVLFMSGYAPETIFQGGDALEEATFLQKPFAPRALMRKVREVLDHAAVSRG